MNQKGQVWAITNSECKQTPPLLHRPLGECKARSTEEDKRMENLVPAACKEIHRVVLTALNKGMMGVTSRASTY